MLRNRLASEMASRVADVNSHFKAHHITLKRDWLEEVVRYLSANVPRLSADELLGLVYHQWLYSDIKQSTEPNGELMYWQNVKQLEKPSVFQANAIQSVADVGTSKWKQNKRLNNPGYDESAMELMDFDNPYRKDPGYKCFCLQITDGRAQFKAFEKKLIRDLASPNCSPGAKILIFGGARVQDGILFLTQQNCQLLGGAFQTLPNTNAQALADANGERRVEAREATPIVVDDENMVADNCQPHAVHTPPNTNAHASGSANGERRVEAREIATVVRRVEAREAARPTAVQDENMVADNCQLLDSAVQTPPNTNAHASARANGERRFEAREAPTVQLLGSAVHTPQNTNAHASGSGRANGERRVEARETPTSAAVEDENMHYAKTLATFMGTLPMRRRFQFRIEIEQLKLKYMADDNENNNRSSSSNAPAANNSNSNNAAAPSNHNITPASRHRAKAQNSPVFQFF